MNAVTGNGISDRCALTVSLDYSTQLILSKTFHLCTFIHQFPLQNYIPDRYVWYSLVVSYVQAQDNTKALLDESYGDGAVAEVWTDTEKVSWTVMVFVVPCMFRIKQDKACCYRTWWGELARHEVEFHVPTQMYYIPTSACHKVLLFLYLIAQFANNYNLFMNDSLQYLTIYCCI